MWYVRLTDQISQPDRRHNSATQYYSPTIDEVVNGEDPFFATSACLLFPSPSVSGNNKDAAAILNVDDVSHCHLCHLVDKAATTTLTRRK